MAKFRREDPDVYHRRGLDLTRFWPPGGESFDDLSCRVVPAFESIAAAGRSATLIVAHARVNRIIIADLLGLQRSNVLRLSQDYETVNVVEYRPKAMVVREISQYTVKDGPSPVRDHQVVHQGQNLVQGATEIKKQKRPHPW